MRHLQLYILGCVFCASMLIPVSIFAADCEDCLVVEINPTDNYEVIMRGPAILINVITGKDKGIGRCGGYFVDWGDKTISPGARETCIDGLKHEYKNKGTYKITANVTGKTTCFTESGRGVPGDDSPARCYPAVTWQGTASVTIK